MTAASACTTGWRNDVALARAEMLSVLVDELNWSGVAYCLLSGYERFPDPGDSDVDFMVEPKHAGRVVPALQATARRCGAMLVQAMQHETAAWYYVLAKPVGGGVAYLHPDCTSDYRRDGRLWMQAERVLAGRKRLQGFYVPAIADEFLYYLIKKVLKQEVTPQHLQRLRELYVRSPEECGAGMRRFWPTKRARIVATALRENDVWRIRWYLPLLLAELQASDPVEGMPARMVQGARELMRRAARVVHPTGLSIAVRGGSSTQLAELAMALEQNLRAAFRRTVIINEDGIAHSMWQWAARVRSTLVIHKLASAPASKLTRDQICFDCVGAPPDVEGATKTALQWMAQRLEKRLGG